MSDKFSISPTEIQRLDGSNVRTQPDFVVVEEPLEIKLVIGQLPTQESEAASPIEKPLSITMRTPGNDINRGIPFLRGHHKKSTRFGSYYPRK